MAGKVDSIKKGDRAGGARALREAAASRPVEGRRAGARVSDCTDAAYVADSEIHGLGMFATGRIKRGVTLGRLLGMPTHEDGIYVLWISDELGLEVINDFRFINHSKDPNCELTDCDVVTLKRIEPDEELTHDYGW